VDIALSSNAVATNFIPSLVYWDFPYLMEGQEHFEKVLDSDVGDKLDQSFEDENFKNIGVQYGGFRAITNSERSLEKIKDFEGLDIRALESQIMLDTYNELPGTSTSTMGFSELYSGLQQGVVNAQDNPLNLIYSM